jgi:hypothetical protein
MERNEAIANAQQVLIGVLDGTINHFEFTRDDGDLYFIIDDLTSTRDEIVRMSDSMQRAIAGAAEYVTGKPARFNSLGVLQSDGSRFDALCMLFAKQSDYAKRALVSHFEAKS